MVRLTLAIAALGGLVGALADQVSHLPPAYAAEKAPTAADDNQAGVTVRQAEPELAQFNRSGNSGGLVLTRHADGHFYASVVVNGATLTMLIDTGASGVALSRDDARKAGIAQSIGMNNNVGEGAGGAVRGEFISIDRVQLGSVEASNVPAVILEGGSMSLLGQQFLRQFSSVEIHGDEMVLS